MEFLLFTLIYWHFLDSIKQLIHGARNSFGIDKAYILDFCCWKNFRHFWHLTKQYIDSLSIFLNLSHFLVWEKKIKAIPQKIYIKRLKIETLKWYNSFENYSGKTACIQLSFEMKKTIVSMYFFGIVWNDIGHCCCCQHLSIVCSFKIRWWKRGCATHTHTHCYIKFGLFCYKIFRSFSRRLYFCLWHVVPSFLLFIRSISILID